jgi:signal transduction histidine kinase
MFRFHSLSSRLLAALIGAQAIAILIAMLVFPLVSPLMTYNDISDTTFRSYITSALRSAPTGGLVVTSTPRLTSYMHRRPGAAFAVYEPATGILAAGSDPLLGKWLADLHGFYPTDNGNLKFVRADGRPGAAIVSLQPSRFGSLLMVTTGNAFHAEDIYGVWLQFMRIFLPAYGTVIFAVFVIVPLIVRLITRPLRRLTGEASRISPGLPGHRLSSEGLAPELLALTTTINAALIRIEEGVAKQRLYAANAAHELRTPVTILAIHIDSLPETPLKAKLQLDAVRIGTLVEQLVTVARLGQNAVAMDDEIDLVAIARAVIADRAPIAFRNGRELAFETERATLKLRGNAAALSSAIANVIDNAIRAEPESGTVLVRLSEHGYLDVIDHGGGIAPEDVPLVFEPFWRKSEKTAGTGLGLAIVKEISERHGICVAVHATSGGGATFRFKIDEAARNRDGFIIANSRFA